MFASFLWEIKYYWSTWSQQDDFFKNINTISIYISLSKSDDSFLLAEEYPLIVLSTIPYMWFTLSWFYKSEHAFVW